MITGKEEALVIEHDAMALRMTGSRNNTKTGLELDRCSSVEDDLRVALRLYVMSMDYSSGAEVVRELGGVGYVVLMGQENVADTADCFEAAHQMLCEPGRIHQPVAVGMGDQIAVGAETFACIESAVVDGAVDAQREVMHDRFGMVTM